MTIPNSDTSDTDGPNGTNEIAYSKNVYATEQGKKIWVQVVINDTDVDITNVDPKSLQAYVSKSIANYVYYLQTHVQAQREFEADESDLLQALHDLDGTGTYDAEGGNPSGVIVDQQWDVDTDDVVAENLEKQPDAIITYDDDDGNRVELTAQDINEAYEEWDEGWEEAMSDEEHEAYITQLDQDTYSSDGESRWQHLA